MDPAEVGKQIKAAYPVYANLDDSAVGTRYLLKHGTTGLKSLGLTGTGTAAPSNPLLAAPPQTTIPTTTVTAPNGGMTVADANQKMSPTKTALPTTDDTSDPDQSTYQKAWKAAATLKDQNALADAWKSSRGYGLFDTKPPTKAEQAKQKLNDAVTKTKSSIQNQLDTYMGLGGADTGAIANVNNLPFVQNFTQGGEYEKQKTALAATLKEIAGAGSGSGVRVTQAELNSWANLLPGIHKTDGQNKQDIALLDKQMRGALGVGLDPEYLQHFGVNPKNDSTPPTQPGIGDRLLKGAAGDVVNGVKGAASIPIDIAKESLKTGNVNGAVGNEAIKLGKGMVNEYGQLVGVSGQNGAPILDPNKSIFKGGVNTNLKFDPKTAINHAIDHPVNTALDLIPLAKAATAGRAGEVGNVAEAAAPAETVPGAVKPNIVQNATRGATDLLNGGGSAKNIQQVARRGGIPQNETLMQDGVNIHPTETGRIQAATKAMDTHGENLSKIYENSDRIFKGSQLNTLIDDKLGEKGMGYNAKDIQFIKSHLAKQGDLELGTGDNLITLNKAWQAAQKLEKNPPKFPQSTEASAGYKQLAKDTAGVIRKALAEKAPESTIEANHYSNYKDYFNNRITDNPKGVDTSKIQNIVTAPAQGVKSGLNMGSNLVFKAAGTNPVKLVRDMRFKQGNPQFKSVTK